MATTFRITALLEGVSYILLLINMLVVKHIDFSFYKSLVFPIGMAHGILFLLYIVLAIMVQPVFKWRFKTLLTVLTASVIPFGTFYVEKYLLKKPKKTQP